MSADFTKAVKAKGWQMQEVAERWGVTPRQLSRIAAATKQVHWDALAGLPDRRDVRFGSQHVHIGPPDGVVMCENFQKSACIYLLLPGMRKTAKTNGGFIFIDEGNVYAVNKSNVKEIDVSLVGELFMANRYSDISGLVVSATSGA